MSWNNLIFAPPLRNYLNPDVGNECIPADPPYREQTELYTNTKHTAYL